MSNCITHKEWLELTKQEQEGYGPEVREYIHPVQGKLKAPGMALKLSFEEFKKICLQQGYKNPSTLHYPIESVQPEEQLKPIEETVEQTAGVDYHYNRMHTRLNEFVVRYGWKDLFNIILAFQSKNVDSNFKLVNSASDDYKRQITRLSFLESEKDVYEAQVEKLKADLALKEQRIADLEKYLPKDSKGVTLKEGDIIRIHWHIGNDYTDEVISYSQQYSYWTYGNNPLCELTEEPMRLFEKI